jgi:hypothetical protein
MFKSSFSFLRVFFAEQMLGTEPHQFGRVGAGASGSGTNRKA